MTDELISWL